ncbi:MAG: sugar ABC transporter permease [Geodermatophilaceae bacterium]
MATDLTQQSAASDAARQARRRRRTERVWLPMGFLAPTLILLFTFDVYPLLLGGWISLWRWGIRAQEFVGLDNYRRMVESLGVGPGEGEVGNSLLVTFFYSVGVVPVTLALSFLVANMLFAKIRGLTFLRTAYFLPFITSTVAAGLAFGFLFNPQIGVLNGALQAVGLPAQTWLLDADPVVPKALGAIGVGWSDSFPAILGGPSVALLCVMVFSVWNTLGFGVVILLAGLVAINPEVHEAARIDGANAWKMATRITLPLLSPTLFFLLVVSTIRSFQSFNEVYVLTSGGGYGAGAGSPLDTTLTLPVLVFRYLYQRPDSVGYSAALSMLLFLLLLAVTLLQFRVAERKVHYN